MNCGRPKHNGPAFIYVLLVNRYRRITADETPYECSLKGVGIITERGFRGSRFKRDNASSACLHSVMSFTALTLSHQRY